MGSRRVRTPHSFSNCLKLGLKLSFWEFLNHFFVLLVYRNFSFFSQSSKVYQEVFVHVCIYRASSSFFHLGAYSFLLCTLNHYPPPPPSTEPIRALLRSCLSTWLYYAVISKMGRLGKTFSGSSLVNPLPWVGYNEEEGDNWSKEALTDLKSALSPPGQGEKIVPFLSPEI